MRPGTRRWLLLLSSLPLAAGLALWWSLLPATLGPVPQLSLELPAASPPPEMSISALPTGSVRSRAVLSYRGGSFGESRDFGMTAFLVRHPAGDLLIDAGFGRDVLLHQQKLPLLMRLTTERQPGIPAAQQLSDHAYDLKQLTGVLLTHAHWDHVSGLDSLPGVPVWISGAEQGFIETGSSAEVARSLGALNWQRYEFAGGSYLGFPRSHDVYGDGAIVLVPAAGHTPGSVIVFVNLPSGLRLAFLGDLVWQLEGIELPAERTWAARMLVDTDAAAVREHVLHVAALHRLFPDVQLIPAHDQRAAKSIPAFPASLR